MPIFCHSDLGTCTTMIDSANQENIQYSGQSESMKIKEYETFNINSRTNHIQLN